MESNVEYRYIARTYDLFDLIFLLGRKGNPRAGLLKAIGEGDVHVLDLCTGTAASSLLVARVHPRNQVLGIDISPDMLAVARRKVAKAGISNLELREMSATALQIADASMDVVMVSFALHEFEPLKRDAALREAARVLKPGGALCVLDFARQADFLSRAFVAVWTQLEPRCFRSFLAIDWPRVADSLGMRLESANEYSFSKVYVLRKR